MRRRKLLAIFIVTFGVGFASITFYAYQVVYAANILVNKTETFLEIPADATFKDLQDLMNDNKIVHNLVAFSFLAKLIDFDEQLKPGRYLLRPNMSNIQTIRMLRNGEQTPVNITFNNIRLIEDLGIKITENIHASPEEFDQALTSFINFTTSDFTSENIISMFIPNTYQVYWTISAKKLIEKMNEEFNQFWNNERIRKAESIGLNPIEVSILASIVQAEQMTFVDEKPKIAGLYINRLKRKIKLDSDPTLVFAHGDFTIKRVLNIHKEIESPYNTYKNKGLPPGPINMPDISSIEAVLNYESHNYLYMVAKEDFSGYHRFATNLREHNVNAERYQRALSIEQRKARLKQSD